MTSATTSRSAVRGSGQLGVARRLGWGSPVLWALVTSLVAALGAVGLADSVAEHSDLAAYDPTVTDDIVAARSWPLTVLAQVLTMVGSEIVVGALTVLVLAWLVLRHRRWRAAWLFGSTMAVTGGLTLVVKHLMSRPRPTPALMLGPVDTGFSFPSGHTLYSTVFFGLVAGLLWQRWARRSSRVLVVAGWGLMSGGVGLSRLYLGYHWLTDVLAGWAIGIGLLAVAAATVLWLRPAVSQADHRKRLG
ncbi:MAG TPA: phosphatase PAP2 family protein [Pedococcus sp.]|nr:phosphatase PAP2 family protein [Pedococcus sp.]